MLNWKVIVLSSSLLFSAVKGQITTSSQSDSSVSASFSQSTTQIGDCQPAVTLPLNTSSSYTVISACLPVQVSNQNVGSSLRLAYYFQQADTASHGANVSIINSDANKLVFWYLTPSYNSSQECIIDIPSIPASWLFGQQKAEFYYVTMYYSTPASFGGNASSAQNRVFNIVNPNYISSTASSTASLPTATTVSQPSSNSQPGYVIPVAVAVPIVAVIGAGLAFFFWRRSNKNNRSRAKPLYPGDNYEEATDLEELDGTTVRGSKGTSAQFEHRGPSPAPYLPSYTIQKPDEGYNRSPQGFSKPDET